jgi:hypothetical protein
VDNGIDPPHTGPLPPVMLLQVTVTAEVGTVAQPANDAAEACTFRVHVLPTAPPDVVQLTVAADDPATLPKSGSVAVKLIVLGFAEIAPKVVAMGKMFDGTTTLAFF